ncbi:TatD family hydrolase [Thiotrichales bacterium 19S9-12]|nr:TatD family hydrolase [Thiotrichales bacterium 19S9-11]MCF6812466.1 TatD family hydrolase [Thiotrichales bacterium 19S9-12]
MLIDTHCHLDFDVFSPNLDSILEEAKEKNIHLFINPSIARSNFEAVINLAQTYPQIHPALGLHPCFIDQHKDDDLIHLEKLIKQHQISIIGEIGLDKRTGFMDRQIELFQKQLILAQKLQLPVIIHSVKTHQDVISYIKNTKFTFGGIIHAFSGSSEIARLFYELGFKLGVGSILSYPKNRLSEIIKELPLDAFVLETDSPDMPIAKAKDRVNTPLSLSTIFEIFCQLRQESKLAIEKQLWHNSTRFLQLGEKDSETSRFI